MNKDRREELLEVVDILVEAEERLSEIRDDEQDALDSMPEGLQESPKGMAMQDAIDTLDRFSDDIVNLQTRIENYAKPKKKSNKK